MKNAFKYTLSLVLFLIAAVGNAQAVEMADGLRSEGKIYVVVLIILIVLGGLIAYLFLIDRKIKHLQKLLDKNKRTNGDKNQ